MTVTRATATATPTPGAAVRYAIAGANPGSGAVTTGADGTAAITWAGANVGTDTLTAFTDANGNGVRDAGEPRADGRPSSGPRRRRRCRASRWS